MGLWRTLKWWLPMWDNNWFGGQILQQKMEKTCESPYRITPFIPSFEQSLKRRFKVMDWNYSWYWIRENQVDLPYLIKTFLRVWIEVCNMGSIRYSCPRHRRYKRSLCSCPSWRYFKINRCALPLIKRGSNLISCIFN